MSERDGPRESPVVSEVNLTVDPSVASVAGPETALIGQLQARATAVLDDVIGKTNSVALLDFPNHTNVGDHAIWLGEVAYLRRRQLSPRYVCDLATYFSEALRARISSETVILLHGGGNFGDLWPQFQEFRETVLADFPDHRIIQLPQTVHFRDQAAARCSAKRLARHRDFTILVRDQQSLLAASAMGLDARLCPDSAFLLGRLPRPAQARHEFLWLLRSDHESSGLAGSPHTIDATARVTDWLDHEPASTALPARIRRHLRWRWRQLALSHPRSRRTLAGALARPYERTASFHLQRGLDILVSGEVVLTDRLHAHILSLLIGRPNVVLDTRFAKVSRFGDTWGTTALPSVRRATSYSEAAELAGELLATGRMQVSRERNSR